MLISRIPVYFLWATSLYICMYVPLDCTKPNKNQVYNVILISVLLTASFVLTLSHMQLWWGFIWLWGSHSSPAFPPFPLCLCWLDTSSTEKQFTAGNSLFLCCTCRRSHLPSSLPLSCWGTQERWKGSLLKIAYMCHQPSSSTSSIIAWLPQNASAWMPQTHCEHVCKC